MSQEMPMFSSSDFGQEVTGSTLGIVGMGRIGLEVAKRAHNGFRMKVLYHSRNQRYSYVCVSIFLDIPH